MEGKLVSGCIMGQKKWRKKGRKVDIYDRSIRAAVLESYKYYILSYEGIQAFHLVHLMNVYLVASGG